MITLFENLKAETSTFDKGSLFFILETTLFFFWGISGLFFTEKPTFFGEKTTFFLYRTPLFFSDSFYHLKTAD